MPGLNLLPSKPLNSTSSILILLLTGVLINTIQVNHYGIIKTYDSYQFISYAEEILQGHLYNDRYIWYFSYAGILAFLKLISLEYESVIYIQVFFFLISVLGLYKLIFHYTSKHWISLLFSLLYILFFEITQRNFYILTESIFTSMIIGILLLLSRIERGSIISKNGMILFLLLLFAGFMRPNGQLMIAAIALALVFFIEKPVIKWLLLILLFVAGFQILDKLIISLDILNEYQRGVVVYNADKVDSAVYSVSGLLMDTADLKPISNDGLPGLLEFIMKNPIDFLAGFLKKVFYMLFHIRPYYSFAHNVFILIFLVPLYALGIYGWINTKRSFLTVWSLSFVLLNIATVGATWCVWEGRFLFPILPVFFLYAGIGMKAALIKRNL